MSGVAGAQSEARAPSGLYAGIHLGAVFSGDIVDDSGTWSLGANTYNYDSRISTDPGFGGGAFVGYKLPIGLRLELELTYRRNSLDELADFSEFRGVDIHGNLDGDISALSYMGNAWYEFNLGAGWMPYLGFGLGAATKFIDCGANNCFGLEHREDGETDFAYQVGAGVAYALTEHTVLSLDYRFFDSVEPDFDVFLQIEDFDYANHNVMIGLRRHF